MVSALAGYTQASHRHPGLLRKTSAGRFFIFFRLFCLMASLILFDGVCNLCNGFVQFVIEHDPASQFQFAALQSPVAQARLREHGTPTPPPGTDPDSVLLLEDGRLYSHSTAILRIAWRLGGIWAVLAAPGWLLPAVVRNAAYRFVARHRYRWFGRQESCWLPTPTLKARFL